MASSGKVQVHCKSPDVVENNIFYKDPENRKFLKTTSDGYVCFYCFGVRPKTEFSNRQIRNICSKTNDDADVLFIRRCLDCSIAIGAYGPNTVVRPAQMDIFEFGITYIDGKIVRMYENTTEPNGEKIMCLGCHKFYDFSAVRNPIGPRPYCCMKCCGQPPGKSSRKQEGYYGGLYPLYKTCPECCLSFDRLVATLCIICDNSICPSCYSPFDPTANGSDYRDIEAFCMKGCEKSFKRADKLAQKPAMRPSKASKQQDHPGEDVFETEVVDVLAGLGL